MKSEKHWSGRCSGGSRYGIDGGIQTGIRGPGVIDGGGTQI